MIRTVGDLCRLLGVDEFSPHWLRDTNLDLQECGRVTAHAKLRVMVSIIPDGEEPIEEICDGAELHEVCLSVVFLSNAACSSARHICAPFSSQMLERSIASLQEEVE